MIDREQIKFLLELMRWEGIATPQNLKLVADRAQDRARQKCSRHGLVEFDGTYWRITDRGKEEFRQAL